MKFFTLAWWCGLQSLDYSDPRPEFRKHLSSIRDRLPKGLLSLQESISLHDAKLRRMEYHFQSDSLTIHLDGDDGHGGLRRFNLQYSDVISITTLADPKNGLNGPHGFGDFGYDEADIDADGNFEHRLLFSSGIEMQIVFRAFELNWKDSEDRT